MSHSNAKGRQAMHNQHTELFDDESTDFPYDITQDSELLKGGWLNRPERRPFSPPIEVLSIAPTQKSDDYLTPGLLREQVLSQTFENIKDSGVSPPLSNTGGSGSQTPNLYVDYLQFDAVGYHAGFQDSLYAIRCWRELDKLMEAARMTKEPVLTRIGNHTVKVMPYGFSTNGNMYGWDIRIMFKGVTLAFKKKFYMPGTHGELDIKDFRQFPNIYANIPGEPLTIYGLQEILTDIESILRSLGFIHLDTGVRRLDVCCDVVGRNSIQEMGWAHRVYEEEYLSRVPTAKIQNQGTKHSQTGITVGVGSTRCKLRVYDKQAELKEKASEHDPRYASALHDRWGSSHEPVTRFEFQFGTEFLREHQDESGHQLRSIAQCVRAMKTLFLKQLRFKNPYFKLLAEGQDVQQAKRTKNHKRMATDQEWEAHVKIIAQASGEVVILKREKQLTPHVNHEQMGLQVIGIADAMANRLGMMNRDDNDRMLILHVLMEAITGGRAKQDRKQQTRLLNWGYAVPVSRAANGATKGERLSAAT